LRAAIVAAALAAGPSAVAQQGVTQATVSGRVDDPSGAAVAEAQVTAKSRERGQVFRARTDGEGRFALSVPIDTYDVRFEHAGFGAATRTLALTVGQAVALRIELPLGGREEQVEVEGEPPLVETVRTQVADTVLPQEVSSLPLNGRNYLDLAALVPAVSRANPVSNQRFPETSAVPGTGLSITGQRFLNNSFVVDGLSANDDAADLAGTFFSQEVIREFQVVTSGGVAEFGRVSAGVVNIATQSGTNAWHGRAYGFLRDDALDAQNPLAPAKDPLRQWQYGATVGGPLRRDRTFAFANVEQTRLDGTGVITIQPAALHAIHARLQAVGYAGPPPATGLFATGYHSTNALLRVDHRPSERLLLFGRYSFYDISSPNARSVGGLNAESRGTALENVDHTLAFNVVATPSAGLMNETRLQYTRSRLSAPPNDLVGPAVTIAGVASFGTSTTSPTARDLDLVEAANVTTVVRGAHAWKAGADVLLNRLTIGFPGAQQGVYTFPSLAGFQAGTYGNFQQAFGQPSQDQTNANLGLFVQDEWRVRRDLTLNLGLRYDVQDLPDPIRTDADNLAPRIGVAYAPGAGRTVVRASYGLYYDRIPLRATSNALQRDGSKYKVAVVPFGTPGAPVFPAVMPQFPDGLLASVTTIDPGIEVASSQQWSLQVERQLGRETAAAVGYLHNSGSGLIVSRNVNVPTLSAAEAARRGVPNLGRPDPRVANVSRFESLGRSDYDGLTVSVRSRVSWWLSGRIAYTLGDARDDAGNAFFFSPQDSSDLRAEWGRSDNDQRHRLVLSGVVEARRGTQLSWIFTYGSALPFNVLTGSDRNHDTNINDRPPGVGRNSGAGFSFASLDLRLGQRIDLGGSRKAELLLEAFNLLNRPNYQLPNSTFGAGALPRPGFGEPTAAADPRQIQLGLRVSF
jgi:hypothetical protein